MKTICREVILRLGDQTDSWTLLDLSAQRKAQTEWEYVNSDFTPRCFVSIILRATNIVPARRPPAVIHRGIGRIIAVHIGGDYVRSHIDLLPPSSPAGPPG